MLILLFRFQTARFVNFSSPALSFFRRIPWNVSLKKFKDSVAGWVSPHFPLHLIGNFSSYCSRARDLNPLHFAQNLSFFNSELELMPWRQWVFFQNLSSICIVLFTFNLLLSYSLPQKSRNVDWSFDILFSSQPLYYIRIVCIFAYLFKLFVGFLLRCLCTRSYNYYMISLNFVSVAHNLFELWYTV